MRWKALSGAVLCGTVLAVLATGLSRQTDIAARAGLRISGAMGTCLGLATCCLALGLYPAVGAVYAYLRRSSENALVPSAAGGAVAAVLVFLWQVLLAVISAPTDPLVAFRQGLGQAMPAYGHSPALLVVGLAAGLGIGLALVAGMGAVGAVLAQALFRARGDQGSS